MFQVREPTQFVKPYCGQEFLWTVREGIKQTISCASPRSPRLPSFTSPPVTLTWGSSEHKKSPSSYVSNAMTLWAQSRSSFHGVFTLTTVYTQNILTVEISLTSDKKTRCLATRAGVFLQSRFLCLSCSMMNMMHVTGIYLFHQYHWDSIKKLLFINISNIRWSTYSDQVKSRSLTQMCS